MKKFLLFGACFLLSINSPILTNAYSLIPGGENIAFEIYPDGIIVTGCYDVKQNSSSYNPERDSDIVRGDRITMIGDIKVTNLESFTSEFYKYKTNGKMPITLIRKKKTYQKYLKLIKIDNTYKTGLYVKERVLGVGTVSYYDPITHHYGALAHEVFDNDSTSIIDVRVGAIYLEDVESIAKSKDGEVGHKNCDITFEDKIGNIEANTEFGIFGQLDEIPSSYTPIEVASWDKVKLGKAIIRTCIEDNKVEEFEIEIQKLKEQKEIGVKGISFKISDKKLLKETGGIYSGMSGSPIIQGEYLVGAVTHVNVDHVNQGYGVYMDYMYQIGIDSCRQISTN